MSRRATAAVLGLGLCLGACSVPKAWELPSGPAGSRAVAILTGASEPRLFLHGLEGSATWTEPEVEPGVRLVAYLSLNPEELRSSSLALAGPPKACERTRPVPVPLLAFEPTNTDWTALEIGRSLDPFHLPALALDACGSGCLAAAAGTYYCSATCTPGASPLAPQRASCPTGWSEEGQAVCAPPTATSCASEPCWLGPASAPSACSTRAVPAGAQIHTGTAAPARIVGTVWLPRGRYVGDVEVAEGGALVGECPEATTIVGHLSVHGAALVEGLSVESGSDRAGVLVVGGTGVRLRSLRLVPGGNGIVLRGGAEVELDSIRVEGGQSAITVIDSSVVGRYLWIATPQENGVVAAGGEVLLEDVIVEGGSSVGINGIEATDGGPGTLSARRTYVGGQGRSALLVRSNFDVQDLRVGGERVIGVLAESSAVGSLQRGAILGAVDRGLWVRATAQLVGVDLHLEGANGGASVESKATLDRVVVEGARRAAIEVSNQVELALQDLTVRRAGVGLQLVPVRGAAGVTVRRALIDGAEVGLVRDGDGVALEAVTVKDARLGLRSSPCWSDESLSQIHLEEVTVPVELEAVSGER